MGSPGEKGPQTMPARAAGGCSAGLGSGKEPQAVPETGMDAV